MPLPGLNGGGVLPAGIHDCTVAEVCGMFGASHERARLWSRFEGFLERLASVTSMPLTLYLDGSFISDWETCCDIDVVIEAREFEGAHAETLKMLCADQVRMEFLEDFSVKIHIVVPGLFSRDYRTWFQRVKTEDSWRFGMSASHLKKGIVRLKP